MGTCSSSRNSDEFENSLIVKQDDIVSLASHRHHQYKNVIIHEGGTLNIDTKTSSSSLHQHKHLILHIHKNCIIHKNAVITVNGNGYIGGNGAKRGKSINVYHKKYDEKQHHVIPSNSPRAKTDHETVYGDGSGGGGGCIKYDDDEYNTSGSGGGGGYGTNGVDGIKYDNGDSDHNEVINGNGGNCYGDDKLTVLHYGSGGGGGIDVYRKCGTGGAGGGILALDISGKLELHENAKITSNGLHGDGYSGGCGSGGTIKIYCGSLKMHNTSKIEAIGGKLGVPHIPRNRIIYKGGDGGYGRIALYIKSMDIEHIKEMIENRVEPEPLIATTNIEYNDMSFLIFDSDKIESNNFISAFCTKYEIPTKTIDVITKYYNHTN